MQLKTPEEAVTSSIAYKYDLILIDLDTQFPNANISSGLHAVQNIRFNQRGLSQHTPIIGMSSNPGTCTYDDRPLSVYCKFKFVC